jgi:hypothetical protein
VDIVFDNCLKVEEIKVMQGPTGLFVSFPAKKQRDGSDRQLAYGLQADPNGVNYRGRESRGEVLRVKKRQSGTGWSYARNGLISRGPSVNPALTSPQTPKADRA